MRETVNFDDLSRPEQIDVVADMIICSERPTEIYSILSVLTAYKISADTAVKYGLDELCADELVETIQNDLNADNCGNDEKAWNVIVDTLGFDKILDVINNFDSYFGELIKIKHLVNDVRDVLFDLYVSKHL